MAFTKKPLRVTPIKHTSCEYINPSSMEINLLEKSFLAKKSNPKTTDATVDPETRYEGGGEKYGVYMTDLFLHGPLSPSFDLLFRCDISLVISLGFSAHASGGSRISQRGTNLV